MYNEQPVGSEQQPFPAVDSTPIEVAIMHWKKMLDTAHERFKSDCETIGFLDEPHRIAAFTNSLFKCHLSIGEANDLFGLSPGRKDIEQFIISEWAKVPQRELSQGERRAIATAICYETATRLPQTHPTAGPMQAAREAGHVLNMTIDSLADEYTNSELFDEFDRRSAQHAEEHSSADDALRLDSSLKKSIQRFKNEAANKSLFRLNPETLCIEAFEANPIAKVFNSKPGRPAQRKKPCPL